MAWFLRVIEQPSGRWTCRHGLQDFDDHPDLEEALAHIHELAARQGQSEVFVHYADGSVLRPDPEATREEGSP